VVGAQEKTTVMKVFFDEECLLHDPPYEILSGKSHPYYEAPKRLLQIRQALEENEAFQIEDADRSIDAKKHALQVHSVDYVEYLETAFRLWVEAGADPKVQTALRIVPILIPAHPPKSSLFPEAFANPKLTHTARPPQNLIGKAGQFLSFAGGLLSDQTAE